MIFTAGIAKLRIDLLTLSVKNDIKCFKFDKMTHSATNSLKYLVTSPNDYNWGVVTTTVGTQTIAPNACYPAMKHPDSYDLKPQMGRVLDEYQLVYITEGSGFFESASMPCRRVVAGCVILLFPDEWHNYAPDTDCGWQEFWIGFRGESVDRLMSGGFFTPGNALINIGVSNSVISLYKDAMRLAQQEGIGCQQMISGVVMHLLSHIYYRYRNHFNDSSRSEEIINEAMRLMREQVHHSMRVDEVADALGVGYSWFRQTFKRITGVSPMQYRNRLIMNRAKELLVTGEYSISELAYLLGFENAGQFSTAFRKTEGVTPSRFRDDNRTGIGFR